MIAVFIRRLYPLQVFGLFMWSLHHTVERILWWRHWESFFSKTWLVVLTLMILFVLCVWLHHLLDLIRYLGVVTSRINHRQSNHLSLLLLTHVEILVLFTEICIIQGRQKLIPTLAVSWTSASHIWLRKRNTRERLLGHVTLHVVVTVFSLINTLIWQPLTLDTPVLCVMSLALIVSTLIIVNKLLRKLKTSIDFCFESVLFDSLLGLYLIDSLLIFSLNLPLHL